MKRRSPAQAPKALIDLLEGMQVVAAELDLFHRRAVPMVAAFHPPDRAPELSGLGAGHVHVGDLVVREVAGGDCMAKRRSDVTGTHGETKFASYY